MKNTKLKKDSYSLYMEELNKEIPIITNQYYIDKDGNKNEIDDILHLRRNQVLTKNQIEKIISILK